MRVEYYWILAAVINLVLFLLHSKAYKSTGDLFRRSWTGAIIGAGCGLFLARLPDCLYDLSSNYTRLVVPFVLWITSAAMALINRKGGIGTAKK
jgi:hypothetical protein